MTKCIKDFVAPEHTCVYTLLLQMTKFYLIYTSSKIILFDFASFIFVCYI